MTAAALLFDLMQCGITPRPSPDSKHLLLPANRLTEQQRKRLSECKADVLELLTDPLLQQLMNAAMKACDYWQDSHQARLEMRLDIWTTPPELRADLLKHFRTEYGA